VSLLGSQSKDNVGDHFLCLFQGLNLRTGTPLNPFNPNHHTGGSSSGSAALVAAGVCPIAIGKPVQHR
jgi:Asp-tRNA(Asn)/Glu-tRNA(Gln) amidotransferase A subunit family amidase